MNRLGTISVLLAFAALALVGCGAANAAQSVESGELRREAVAPQQAVTSSVEVQHTADRLIAVRKEAIAACEARERGIDMTPRGDVPPVEELRKGPVRVGGGPDCEPGWVDPIVLSDQGNDGADDPHPIYAEDAETIIGYWINGLGWMPAEIVAAPDFDLKLWLEAEDFISAPEPNVSDLGHGT